MHFIHHAVVWLSVIALCMQLDTPTFCNDLPSFIEFGCRVNVCCINYRRVETHFTHRWCCGNNEVISNLAWENLLQLEEDCCFCSKTCQSNLSKEPWRVSLLRLIIFLHHNFGVEGAGSCCCCFFWVSSSRLLHVWVRLIPVECFWACSLWYIWKHLVNIWHYIWHYRLSC